MKSEELQTQAQKHLVGGVGAGGRFHPLLGRALYFSRAHGSRMWDVDGNEYIDFFTGSGANFLGHDHPVMREAIERALEFGLICNGDTEYHARLADLVSEAVPCAEKLRFANSGTEATLAAIRIARAYTGKQKILKFEGHFHGMHEFLWFNCAAGVGETGRDGTVAPLPDSEGIPPSMADLLVVVPFNDPDAFTRAVRAHRDELAAVIVEPIAYNQGCIPAGPGFLQHVRRVCTECGIVLIFDEVLSGFRMCRGGGQEYFGVTPDLCTLAKALGGGVPIAAVAGRSNVMAKLNPAGHTIMSGTYTGHLISVMGALACQMEIAKPGFYDRLNALGDRLYKGITEALRVTGTPAVVQGIGARFGIYWGVMEPVTNYRQVVKTNREMEIRFLRGCLKRGLYFHDYGHTMHHGFSSQHSAADIDEALNIIEDTLRHM